MERIGPSLKENKQWLQSALGKSVDLKLSRSRTAGGIPTLLCWMEGLVDSRMIQEGILHPLQTQAIGNGSLEELAIQVLETPGWHLSQERSEALSRLIKGQALLFVEGQAGALALATRGGVQRKPEEPTNEPSVRGPRDGFVEHLATNRALLRRKTGSPDLRFERHIIGRESQTRVEIAYIEGKAATDLVDEVRRRLAKINTVGILDAGMIEEWIEDNPYSPFPQADHTGRPDKAVAALWAGRVAILVDQSPSALLVPTVFWHFLHVPEDYYERWWAASAIRLLRVTGVALSFTLPGLWIMLISFHQELLPTPLALSVAAGRERVPIPALLEALAMEVTFELLREAGARLPRAIGQTVSIVGALVIGQAAVQAGLVSPTVVIVVAFTGLASFITPSFSAAYAFRLLRFAVLLAAGTLGLLGFSVMVMLILLHLLHLKSFGVNYLSPVLPYKPDAAGEAVIRPDWHWLKGQRKRWWSR